jgi:hypothetical protein
VSYFEIFCLTRLLPCDKVDCDSLEVQLRHLLSALTISTAILFSAAAHADSFVNDFTFSSGAGGYSGSFSLDGVADPYASNAYDITSALGTVTGPGLGTLTLTLAPITGVMNSQNPVNDPASGFIVDDVYFKSGVFDANTQGSTFDWNGLLLIDSDGNYYNFYGIGDQTLLIPIVNSGPSLPVTGQNLSTLPEPSSFALCGTGLLAVVGAVRRKVSKS